MRRYGESKAHEKQKERIAQILREHGWQVWTEYPFSCSTEKGPRTYYADVYAQNYSSLDWQLPLRRGDSRPAHIQDGSRRVILEVQGTKGHNTKLAHTNDRLRIADIRAAAGPIEYKELFFKTRKSPNDIRNWSEADIAEELGL